MQAKGQGIGGTGKEDALANFTSGIKREFLNKKPRTRQGRTAVFSAFVRTGGCISFTQEGLGFFLVTESEKIAEYYIALAEELYGVNCVANASADRLRGRDKLTVAYNGEKAYDILIDAGIFERGETGSYELYSGIPSRIVADEESRLAYIRGAFLGGGSCTLPRAGARTGYHLEFVFAHEETARDFASLLASYELIAKIIRRKDSFVVYLAALSAVSDFLAVMGAEKSLEKLNETAEAREEKNNSNRVNNCFVGNMDRTATAAAGQCLAIGYLEERGILPRLDEDLKAVAAARLADREASLSELAEGLQISKSCINHRMRRIMELYKDLKGNEEKRDR